MINDHPGVSGDGRVTRNLIMAQRVSLFQEF